MKDSDTSADQLSILQAGVARALELLGEPVENWVPPRAGIDHDIVIAGAGQSGLAIAFALKRKGIRNIKIIDAAAAGQEGPWRAPARMLSLRSPKELAGPELGIAQLTFRAWYEAGFGEEAYQQLGKIPTDTWMDYLNWYRQMIGVEIANGVTLSHITPLNPTAAGGFCLTLQRENGSDVITTRKLILASGMDGAGRPYIPELVQRALPREYWAHAGEDIDFERLRGKQVAVLGAASSAFDNAAAALENGAAGVNLYCRRASLARVNPGRGISYPGVLDHYADLPDELKWRVMLHYFERATPAVRETVERCTRHGNFRLHFASPWHSLSVTGNRIRIETPKGKQWADYAILGTGFEILPAARAELAAISPYIALWGERYRPESAHEQNQALAQYPYLGAGFEFIEKQPGSAPWLRDIHCYNYAAVPCFGRAAGDIGSIKHGIPRLIAAIGKDLVLADGEQHVKRILAFAEPELSDEEMQILHTRYRD